MHPSDEDLVAYLDGELGEAETAALETQIAADDAVKARLQALTETAALVREAFDDVLREPVPASLLQAASVETAANVIAFQPRAASSGRRIFGVPQRWAGLAAAASVFGLVCGGSVGYAIHTAGPAPSPLDNIASYHNLFIGSAEAGENAVFDVVPGAEQKLPSDIHIPDLKPWQLEFEGARKIVVEGKVAYQFYYRTDNKELGSITLTLWESTREDRIPTFDQRENVNVMYWRHSGRGYAIVGHADKGYMWGLAQDVAYQLKS